MGRFRIYNEESLRQQLRHKRWQLMGVLGMGWAMGLLTSGDGPLADEASSPINAAVAAAQFTPASPGHDWCLQANQRLGSPRLDCQLHLAPTPASTP